MASATIERDFLELMHQTIIVEKLIRRDPIGGDPVYDPPKVYRGRVVNKQRLIVDAQGQERMATTTAWFFGAPNITTDDRITLPDGRQPFILAINHYPDEKGMHHVRVDFA